MLQPIKIIIDLFKQIYIMMIDNFKKSFKNDK